MYLTFELSSKQLINFSKTYEKETNVNFNNFVYLDDYIAIKYDKTISHVETRLDEDSSLSVIVPGQFELSENELESLLTYNKRQQMLKKAKTFVDNLMKENNLVYYLGNESKYEKKLLKDVATHFGMTIQAVKDLNRKKYEEKIQKLLYIDVAYEKFLIEYKTLVNDFDNALQEFIHSVRQNIDNLTYTGLDHLTISD